MRSYYITTTTKHNININKLLKMSTTTTPPTPTPPQWLPKSKEIIKNGSIFIYTAGAGMVCYYF